MTIGARRWSARSSFERRPSELARLVAQARAQARTLTDLTESNPTLAGLQVPPELLAALADPAAARYDPAPLGTAAARDAVAAHYQRSGLPATAAHIALTASSSEAYGWLFKLLCDPGDGVLVPRPSYPLLPFLAALEAAELESYPLRREEGWRIDLEALEQRLGPRTRAIVLVHPNNPTGTLVRRSDAEAVGRLAAAHGLALIVDEVFVDYLHGPPGADRLASFAGFGPAVCFVLGGLSKLALLPQLKLGWIACYGPPADVDEAMARLEVIADSFLSVSTPVQLALPAILTAAPALQATVRQRLRDNLAALDRAIARQGPTCPVRRLALDGGWYAMVEVPRTRSDDEWVARLVEREGLIVHPGYFFDVEEQGTMVVSLLGEPETFAPAIDRAVSCWSVA